MPSFSAPIPDPILYRSIDPFLYCAGLAICTPTRYPNIPVTFSIANVTSASVVVPVTKFALAKYTLGKVGLLVEAVEEVEVVTVGSLAVEEVDEVEEVEVVEVAIVVSLLTVA